VAFAEWYKSSVFDKALQADRRVSRIPRFQIAIENDERGVAADGECREVERRLCAQWTSGRGDHQRDRRGCDSDYLHAAHCSAARR
jgi:hypothetical protein